MRIAEFSAAVACLVANLCILEGACASEDTTVAAALRALAYVPAADTAHSVDAANTRPSVFATQTSPTDLPYGTPACLLALSINQDVLECVGQKVMQGTSW